MPTYRYECGRCHAVHEVFHSISDEPKTKCPDCGGRLTRLIGSGGGVILKGSGFYTTDYRSESYRSAARKEKDAVKADPAPQKDGGTKDGAPKKDGGTKGGDKPAKGASPKKKDG